MNQAAASRATMKDVAARAGVGLATVSRVVNGDAKVSEKTRILVDQAIADLSFRRNDSARLLRQGIAASIGVVLDDVADPFFSTLNRAVETQAIARKTLSMTASTGNDAAHAKELIMALCARRVDGLIVAAPHGTEESYLADEIRAGTPVVFVDRPPVALKADAVLSDNAGGARLGVQHLIAHGHRKIACLSDGSNLYSVGQRIEAYRRALAEAGIQAEPVLEHSDGRDGLDLGQWLEAADALPESDRPTALFCTNSRASVAVLRALRNRSSADPGARWPALLCFDDFELADVVLPGITVVAQDPAAIGAAAADLLFRRLDGDNSPASSITVPTRLIVRGSAETPPVSGQR